MLKLFFKITLLLLIAINSNAQSPITFEKHYGGIYRDFGSFVVQLPDSGYIVSGTYLTQSKGNDIGLYRTNKYGDTLWSKRYGGSANEGVANVIPTHDGGFLIAGNTASYGVGVPNSNIWIVKINSVGDTLWTKVFGGTGSDGISYGMKTSDNGFLLVGLIGNGFTTSYAIKTDSMGNQLYAKYFGIGSGNDMFRHCTEKYPGVYAIVGKCFYSNYDSYIVLADTALNVLTYKVYNMNNAGAGVDVAMQIEPFQNGYLVGLSTGRIMRLKDDLDTIRTKKIPTTPNWTSFNNEDKYYDFKTTYDGNLIFASTSPSPNDNVVIMKTDTNLVMLWKKYYGTATWDFGRNLIQTSDRGYAIGGTYMYSYNTANTDDFYLIKTDSMGNVGIATNLINRVSETVYFYPNPVENQIIFKTNNEVESIQIINSVGQIIDSVHSKNLSEITFNTSDFPPGIYFVEMALTDNSKITKKFIKE